jgi:hypothetical protein
MKSGVVSARYDLKILFVIMLHVLDRLDFSSLCYMFSEMTIGDPCLVLISFCKWKMSFPMRLY